MLTQFQIIQRQAALLAACPRALALSDVSTPTDISTSTLSVSAVTTLPVPSVPSAWSHSAPISGAAFPRVPGLGAVAVEPRRSPSGNGPRSFGFGGAERPATAVRPRTGFAAPAAEGYGNGRRDNGTDMTTGTNGSNNVKQQDEQYLTARRGPVTWRPPH
jgi:hypothetical protein